MRQTIMLWFALSDLLAWLLLAFALVAAALFPFAGPVHARMTEQSLTMMGVAGTCMLWLAVAAGAYAIIRRKALGLVPVLAPAIVLAVSGRAAFALSLAAIWAVVFAAPFLLVLFQALPVSSSKSPAES
jgi:hypothetical protein